jgi:biotin-dependent carboxylase-like uncharacterized protein
MIEVVAPGPLCTIQDRGRIGFAAQGVPRAGAFDRAAHALANRLVGNPPDAAAFEITLGGLAVRLHTAATVALTGAPCPGLDWGAPATLPAGSLLRLATPLTGLRSYLAVRGGVDIAPVLGSRSTDTLSGLGPAPLRAGDLLPVGPQPSEPPSAGSAAPAIPRETVRIVPGPREDWFGAGALQMLTSARWRIAAQADRIGVRLDGPALPRARTGELPSEPTLPGAIQVPHGGQPIVLGPDAPVTGGYPVIAVVVAADLDVVGQLRPGASVRLVTRGAR